MGLRREASRSSSALDCLLVAALLLSGAIWFWVSAAGVEPALIAALSSFPGRLFAAAFGAASVVALVRAFLVWRSTDLDHDGTVL
jgi:hypothetical protein